MTIDHSPTGATADEHQQPTKTPSGGVELVHTGRMPPATGRADLVFRERVRRPETERGDDAISE
jgi:hypothetical protein